MALENVVTLAQAELARRERVSQYLHDPVLWAREYLGIKLWRAQREFIESIRDNRNTAVAAGHGVGKTFGAAIACAWWIDVHPPERSFIASTAPSVDQVALLWDNIRRIHGLAAQRFKEGLVDHPLPGYVTGDNKWKLPDGTMIGQGRRPPENKADVAFQGRHADYLFAIGDEAVGLSKEFLNALGVIATGQWNRQLLIANPTDPTSAMADIWRREDSIWKTMHISVMDSPLITPEDGFSADDAPGISGWDYIEWAQEEYGCTHDKEDREHDGCDPRYLSRVLGQWAFDAGNNVYTQEELARAKNTAVLPYSDERPEIGVDIARQGKDSTQVYIMRRGEVWDTDPETGKPTNPTGQPGMQIRKIGEWKNAPLTGSDPQNLGTDQRIHALACGEGVSVVKPDASGIGGGVIDGLLDIARTQGQRYFIVEMYGQSTIDVDTRQFINARASQFFALKKMMQKGTLDLDPEDERLFAELSGIIYENDPKGRVKIESKDDMRKRGVKSPDAADAVWYASFDASNLIDPPDIGSVISVDPEDIGFDFGFEEAIHGAGAPFL